jgi:hypothetical protein
MMLEAMQGLIRSVEQARAVVTMRQEHARFGGRVGQGATSTIELPLEGEEGRS